MIDLTLKSLPDAVTVGGRDFFIKTDFRTWLNFEKTLKEDGIQSVKLNDILQDFSPVPTNEEINEFIDKIFEFFESKNVCPKDYGGGGESVLDYQIDGDYIYAAFVEQYGIDLCDIEYLHWHKFLALVRSISDDTMLGKIMSYRGYKNSGNKSYEKQMKELKAIWALPIIYTDKEKQQMKEFDDYFG